MKVAVFSLFFLCLVMIFSTGTAHAAEDGSMIYVNGSSGNDSNDGYTWLTAKKTIGNATETVTSGGTVTIGNGTYTGVGNVDIYISDDMTITGLDRDSTIIDADGASRIFTITDGATVTIENLTLTNGLETEGGAVYNNGHLTVNNCNITDNTAEYGGGIFNAVFRTCTVTNSYITGNTATKDGGGIFNHATLYVTDSYITDNSADDYGGGIYSKNSCTITGTTITGNTAEYGGGIYDHMATLNVTETSLTDNSADYGGGIYNDLGTLDVTGTTFTGNSADYGGGIYNYLAELYVSMCDFESNQATIEGNAIRNTGGLYINRIIQFSRFYDQAAGYEIYSTLGFMDAQYNWWGSNEDPTSKVSGSVDVSPWLILKINATPVFIGKNDSSTITANLWFDSDGNYHDPTNEHIKDGISVAFYTTIGILNSPILTSNGSAVSTLTPNMVSGLADVFAILDDQFVQTQVIIDATSPTVTTIDPEDNEVINDTSKVVKVTFSEAVQEGSAYDDISITCNGTPVLVVTNLNSNILTITNTGTYADGTYTVTIPADAVMDSVGNGIDLYTSQFTVDTTPPAVTSVDPVDGAVIKSTDKVVTVTFSKDIFEGTTFDDITISCNGTPLTTITKAITGNVLTLTNIDSYADGTYTVNIPADAVVDIGGYNLETAFTSDFTVDTVAPVITSTDPVNGATNLSDVQVITVTFSEDVVLGTGWFELIDRNTGTAVDFTRSINGNVLTITPTSDLTEGWYKVIIHTGSVTDLAGNMVAVKSFTFSVGTSPTITATSPVNGATDVNPAKTITVTFSEAIRKSSHFWVELVDSAGNAVAYTSYITGGNMLVIDPTGDLAAGTTYKVKLHTGCVTDLAGNPVAPYIFSFTTKNT